MMVAYSLDNDRTRIGVLMEPDAREAFPDLIAQAEGNAPPVSRIKCPDVKAAWCRDRSMVKAAAVLQMSNKSRYDDIGCRQSDTRFQTSGVLAMLKTVLAFVMMFYAAFCFATVDANKASAAELDSVKGIGPALSTRIIDERAKGQFKDWADFIGRVKGLGEGNAAKLSAQGLTVGGAGFRGTTPTTAAKREGKPAAPAAKTDEKPTAASTMVGKADDKASKSAPAAAPASAASAAKK